MQGECSIRSVQRKVDAVKEEVGPKFFVLSDTKTKARCVCGSVCVAVMCVSAHERCACGFVCASARETNSGRLPCFAVVVSTQVTSA